MFQQFLSFKDSVSNHLVGFNKVVLTTLLPGLGAITFCDDMYRIWRLEFKSQLGPTSIAHNRCKTNFLYINLYIYAF